MNEEPARLSHADIDVLRAKGEPLFGLGSVYGTPAALAYLQRAEVSAAAMLRQHQHGTWGAVDSEDAAANDQAVCDGSRILSAWDIGGERIWIITDAADDTGTRTSTCILFRHEY